MKAHSSMNKQELISTAQIETALVLVVDDDLGMRRILRQLLEQDGLEVIEATNGQEALELYHNTLPDIVLLDAMMPIMDGFICCQQLCNLHHPLTLPILIITTLDEEFYVKRAFEVGATDYITKPINGAVLRQRVQRLIQQSRLMQQVQQMNETLDTYAQNLNVEIRNQTAEIRRSLEFESTLKHITDRVRDSLDENTILQTVVQELAWALELGCCNASIYDSEQRISQVQYEYTASIPGYQNRTIEMDNCPEIYQRLLQGDSVHFCPLTDHAWRGQVALFAFPIRNGKTMGDIWLASHTDRILDDLEIRLIQQVTNQCAIALRQARLYQAAQTTVAELERLNQLKDDFLSTVSHELRSPLANMRLAIQMLKGNIRHNQALSENHVSNDAGCNKSATYLQILHDECEREINLVEDLLDLQRLEAGHQSRQVDAIRVKEFISSIVASFRERISDRQQTLVLDLDSNLPDVVTDTTSFKRIVTELLHNACKYTPPRESITVAAYSQAGKLYLSVTNSGVEIPAQEAPRIFDKFYRIPNGDPWKQGGTGLGLALVKKLVNHLGGSIQVTSASRQTCFTIELSL